MIGDGVAPLTLDSPGENTAFRGLDDDLCGCTCLPCCYCSPCCSHRRTVKVNLHILKIAKHVSSFDFEE